MGAGVDVVMSVGLCGALAEGLEVGDIVVASSVNGVVDRARRSSSLKFRVPARSFRLIGWRRRSLKSRICGKPGRSRWRWRLRRCWSGRAAWGVPFYCIRAVSDTANEGFELDLNARGMTSGRFQCGPDSGAGGAAAVNRSSGVVAVAPEQRSGVSRHWESLLETAVSEVSSRSDVPCRQR